ncbi:cytochrome c peroxidase [Parachlamydia sp. AcF125]|uniref:cytochrome-c peroxidase n=1 Tax=Parachlamydia sp. AcF125 TaxID=2795736 RepID=UPI001BC94773|nr:cytochrome c peroxidase [Parachlamydia sp. AcF125]MBS4168707.1 Cytochrome c551 peroxidase [Parachlamydia sp. AcF125]
MKGFFYPVVCILAFLSLLWGTFQALQFLRPKPLLTQEQESFSVPLGLPPLPWPANNPYDKAKAELGRLLYFDKRLSSDGTVSCATCHSIQAAFADHQAVSQGIDGRQGSRNSPTVINSAYHNFLFWDGRADSLEAQCKGPLANRKEMTLAQSPDDAHRECQERIRKIPGYKKLFKSVYGNDDCSIDDIAKAIATFERTILSGNSPYDRYIVNKDKSAMSAEAIHGLTVFKRSGCANCHVEPLFADDRFTNIGIGMDAKEPDLGRYAITHNQADWGAFKIPTLRDVEHTFPYMHDGSLKTLEEVVEYYNQGGIPNSNLHPLMRPLNLSESDKKALVKFLQSLSGEGWQIQEPSKFPD